MGAARSWLSLSASFIWPYVVSKSFAGLPGERASTKTFPFFCSPFLHSFPGKLIQLINHPAALPTAPPSGRLETGGLSWAQKVASLFYFPTDACFIVVIIVNIHFKLVRQKTSFESSFCSHCAMKAGLSPNWPTRHAASGNGPLAWLCIELD